MKLNQQLLKEFLHKAGKSTYASEDSSIRKKQKDFSTTIIFQEGDYLYHDNYFGGEPYGGREVIFYKNKPVWMMVYYGWVENRINPKEVYGILTKALRNSTIALPYRGPKEFIDNNMKYINQFEGDLDKFHGVEKIYKDKKIVYQAKYMGGLIDK